MREKAPSTLTADELFNEARCGCPTLPGTVYHNLKMMELDGESATWKCQRPDRYD